MANPVGGVDQVTSTQAQLKFRHGLYRNGLRMY